jgi:beta-mannanase
VKSLAWQLGAFLLCFILIKTSSSEAAFLSEDVSMKVRPPAHGAYVGAFADFGATEESVTPDKIRQFEELSGKKMAWAYFSDNWLDGVIRFPAANVEACQQMHVIPYIRLSPWSEMVDSHPDKIFSMQKIIDGKFDLALSKWAAQARDSRIPIMIEFGPEVNGDWFPWNGKWNGGGVSTAYGDPKLADGPERFRDAYRHLIDLFRKEHAFNITWILHVDASGSPESRWNEVKNYYPGDEYVDWIGVSVFGAQLPTNNWILFPATLKNFWAQISATSPDKPVLISEFGVIEDPSDPHRKEQWLHQALQSISRGLFKNVKGITYWNSPGWLANKKADFSIASSPLALEAYRSEMRQPFWLSEATLGDLPQASPTLPINQKETDFLCE